MFLAKSHVNPSHRNRLGKRAKLECTRCGYRDHKDTDCRTKPENYKNKVQENTAGQSTKKPEETPEENKTKNENSNVILMTSGCDEQPNQDSNITHFLKDQWIADSGASSHICNNQNWFKTLEIFMGPRSVTVGDESEVKVIGCGDVEISCQVEGNTRHATLSNVLHAPKLVSNLISIGEATAKGIDVMFDRNDVKFVKDSKTALRGIKIDNNLYLMDIRARKADSQVILLSQAKRTLEEWHKALGHASKKRVAKSTTQIREESSAMKGYK